MGCTLVSKVERRCTLLALALEDMAAQARRGVPSRALQDLAEGLLLGKGRSR
jgi:hypothetical protein